MKKNLLLFLCLFPAIHLSAQWSSQTHFKVTEMSGVTLTDYQVKLVVNTQQLIQTGQMESDGRDIRFSTDCNGMQFLPHWVDTGMNTSATTIWVKLDSIPANGERIITMLHGNASATSTSTLSVFEGPFSSTDSVSGGTSGGVFNSQRSFRFSPTEDILVTQFGKYEPNGSSRFITLFDYTSQAIMRQMQVSGPAAAYSYDTLNTHLWLTNGTQYLLSLFQGANDGYYYQNTTQIGQHLNFYDMRYCNGCTENTFPTMSLTGLHYGYPDLLYYVRKHAVTEPSVTLSSGGNMSVTATTQDDTICVGETTILHATPTGNYFYAWTPVSGLSGPASDSPIATPTVTTTYTVLITDTAGCTGSKQLTIHVNQLPAVSIQSFNPDTLCVTAQHTLNSGTPAGGTYSGAGVTGNSFHAGTAGVGSHSITYTYTDTNGCVNSANRTILVEACTGITEMSDLGISVFPNPAAEFFVIRFDKMNGPAELKLTDNLGRVAIQQQLEGVGEETIQISQLSGGVYIGTLRTAGKETSFRLVIQ